MKQLASHAINLVSNFFSRCKGQVDVVLPPVLRKPGKWVAFYDDSTLGVFYLTNKEIKRVTKYQNNGWPPFPGFFISDKRRPKPSRVAIAISGECNLFSSNRTKNMFSFSVSPGASFTVVDHYQEIKDISGKEFKYKVDLAFVLGIIAGESLENVEKRILELLNHSMNAWRNMA